MKEGIRRLLFALAPVVWFVLTRSAVFYFFLGGPDDRFLWWWSWFFAIPVSVVSAGVCLAIIAGVAWVFEGFTA